MWAKSVVCLFFTTNTLFTCQDQYPWVFNEIYSFCYGENVGLGWEREKEGRNQIFNSLSMD